MVDLRIGPRQVVFGGNSVFEIAIDHLKDTFQEDHQSD